MTGPGSEDQFAAAEPLPPRRRGPSVLIGLVVVGFVAALVLSTTGSQTPAGGAGAMAGMQMGPGEEHVAFTARDVDGRPLTLPGGAPGVVLTMAASGCPACSAAARTVAAAAQEVPGATATLVGLDPVDTRADFSRFARAAGSPAVRYALDDRGGSLAALLDAGSYGEIVVFDAAGMVTARLRADQSDLASALREALTGS